MSKSSFNSPVTACCSSRAHEDIKQLIVLQVYWLKLRLIYFQTSPSKKSTTYSLVSCESLPGPTNLMARTLPRQTAANCIVTLQICSSNQLNLTWGTDLTTGMIRILGGSPLVTWDRDESGITMKPEIVCYCYLPVFLSSFSIHPAPHAHVCPLYSILQGCGNKVWLVETKPKGNCLRWETRNSSDLYYRAHLPSPECKNLWFGRWNMQSLRGNEIAD